MLSCSAWLQKSNSQARTNDHKHVHQNGTLVCSVDFFNGRYSSNKAVGVNEDMRGVEELISSIAEDPSINKEQLYQTSAIQDPALGVEAGVSVDRDINDIHIKGGQLFAFSKNVVYVKCHMLTQC